MTSTTGRPASTGRMRIARLIPGLFLCTAAAQAAPALTRVTLSQGGVAQYDFTAESTGPITLDIPLDQVDDVLKSLRVEGEPFSLRLPGRQPLDEVFRTLPFAPSAFASAADLLRSLTGAQIRLPASGLTGSILAVNAIDTVRANNAGTEVRHRLTIATPAGIESVTLEDAGAVEFTSEVLRNQIASALQAAAAARAQDRRAVQLVIPEGPARQVHFGYVTSAPVWKASYRLTSPPDGPGSQLQGRAQLQGYAVVENLSGQAWHDVEVVLTSGQPVLYHQALYTALFARRPDAPVDVPGQLQPRLDQGSMPAARMAIPMPSPEPGATRALRAAEGSASSMPPPAPPPPAEAGQSVTQVTYRLTAKVDAAAGETLLLPLIDRAIPAQRVALYQPNTNPQHPLVALLLKNDGEAGLPPGLVSLYEQQAGGPAFVGDARLPTLLPGEDRLASFAADLAATAETTREDNTIVTSARASRGVLEFRRQSEAVTTYRITAPASSARTALIEHDARAFYELTEPLDGVVKTPGGYRIERQVPPGTTVTVLVVLSRPDQETLGLTDAEPGELDTFISNTRLTPKLRAGLQKLVDLRADLDRKQATLATLQERRTTIGTDQDRLRANLTAVPPQSELQRRYLAQMLAQENELTTLQTQTRTAQAATDQADAALKDAILGLDG